MEKIQMVINDIYYKNIDSYLQWLQSNPIHIILLCIDIILVIYLGKKIYGIIKNTNAIQLVKGILILVIITIISGWCQLYILNFILKSIMTYGVLLIMIVFQPELRRALGDIGKNKRFARLFNLNKNNQTSHSILDIISKTCEYFSKNRIGALMVITRDVKLGEYIQTGVSMDANVTAELITNIFEPNTPLHDGAIIIDGNKIKAGACILPLTKRNDLRAEFGTRHRACIGISEVADCIAVVVSEETGKISVAVDGKISTNLTEEQLNKFIKEELEK